MASSEEDASEAAEKKCKYCKNGVEKVCVKCYTCKVKYHHSCSLRLTGMLVISGSKSLIQCPTCAKNGRDEDVNKAVKEAIMPKDQEIEALKYKLADIESAKAQETQQSKSTADKNTNPNNMVCCQNGESLEICNNSKLLKKDVECFNRECTLLKSRINDLEYISDLQKVVISSYEGKSRKMQDIEVDKHPPLSPPHVNTQTLGVATHPWQTPVPAGYLSTSTVSGTQTNNYTMTTMKNGNSVGSSFASAVRRQNLTPAVSAVTSTGNKTIKTQSRRMRTAGSPPKEET
ncbi:hypothetical protein JTB14_003878 [Gonioctena quinquepunctata]|nr:hypothetical protein JTB14_003878 [Gonioctena quinquepunctata]